MFRARTLKPGDAYPVLRPLSWSRILDLLETELKMVGAEDVVMQLELNDRDIRNDGTMRADARPLGPGVILEFTATKIEGAPRLSYPCDTFTSWQANVRAIAAILEALRKVERYGGVKNRQYQGFKALPSKTSTTLSTEAAADIIARESKAYQAVNILANRTIYQDALRTARAKAHPDKNQGQTDLWETIERARTVIDAYFAARR